MGVNTKMFVATDSNNILKLMPKLIKAINVWQRDKLDTYCKSKGFKSRMEYLFQKDSNNNKVFTNGIYNVSTTDFRSFNIYFTVHGEKRALFITHECSCDYSDTYEGEKIIFSLGASGMSEEIMMVVAEIVKEFGDVYYTPNDGGEKFKLIHI